MLEDPLTGSRADQIGGGQGRDGSRFRLRVSRPEGGGSRGGRGLLVGVGLLRLAAEDGLQALLDLGEGVGGLAMLVL